MFKRHHEVAPPRTWTEPRSRPRALVEDADGASQWATARILERAGFDVSCCDGPDSSRTCPLVQAGECELATGADVIFNKLELDRVENRDVVTTLRGTCPATPLIVEVPQPQAERLADTLAGCELLFFPATPDEIRKVASAVRTR